MPNNWVEPLTPPYGTDENGNRINPLGSPFQIPGIPNTQNVSQQWSNPFGASNVGGGNQINMWRYQNRLPPQQPQPVQRTINAPSSLEYQKQQLRTMSDWERIGNAPSPQKPKTVPQRSNEQRIADQYSQSNAQNKAYSLLRSQANMTTQQKQGQGWGEMRKQLTRPQSVSAMYIRGNALTQAIKSVEQRNFWANAYQQLNAALRPVNIPLTTPQNTGGGGGYPWYGYGGGGGGYKKQAQPLDSVVWRTNQ